MKIKPDWPTVVYMDDRFRPCTRSIIEYKNLHKLKPKESTESKKDEANIWSGHGQIHIVINKGTWYKNVDTAEEYFTELQRKGWGTFESLRGFPGYISSVLIDEQPIIARWIETKRSKDTISGTSWSREFSRHE